MFELSGLQRRRPFGHFHDRRGGGPRERLDPQARGGIAALGLDLHFGVCRHSIQHCIGCRLPGAEWLPSKIEKQIAFASDHNAVLISCLTRVVTPTTTHVRPQGIYDNRLPLDEYLFDRRKLSAQFGFIQTSSYLMPRSLFDRMRFNINSPHDDWDFVLHLSKELGVRIETVPEVLVILYSDAQCPSLSTKGTWRDSLVWIDSVRAIITPRAYSGFCLSVVGSRAAKTRALAPFFCCFIGHSDSVRQRSRISRHLSDIGSCRSPFSGD